jgi:tetratricopeptide (TPR) repeat protein
MSEHSWKNIYNLSTDQLNDLDEAEDMIEMMDLTKAETILLKMYKEDPTCVPVLNVLGHMYGRHLSDFESAIKFYNLVLDIEPDNAWARDERRKYSRYLSYD